MPKSALRESADPAVVLTPERWTDRPERTEPTQGDIADRAFERYCARGCEDGHDVEDWLAAERELREEASAV
jgi:hypothetical protein